MLFPKRHSLVLQPWWWLRRGRLAGQRGLGGWGRGGGDGGKGGGGQEGRVRLPLPSGTPSPLPERADLPVGQN